MNRNLKRRRIRAMPTPAQLAAAALIVQAFYRGNVDRRLVAGLAAFYIWQQQNP